MCLALQDARIRAHYNLVTLLGGCLVWALQQWVFHRQMSTPTLLGMETPLYCRHDGPTDLDLAADGDPALAAGLLRKRQDVFTVRYTLMPQKGPYP